jgi:hypothetical protein
MYPKLVENKIKNTVHYNLHFCHRLKEKYFNFLYNIFCFIILTSIISSILYFKFKGQDNKEAIKKRNNEKRDYLLYNLRKFQNISNKSITNIPFN